ncbi:MAG TPA: UbiD family decarboxylase [Xanthobacteraceae bacterium]|nr:UbiD family decarboxylase [Xanthobacteraceae bacterium]
MEQVGFSPKLVPDNDRSVETRSPQAVPWKDLRDWIDLVESHGLLKRIAAPVDVDEEISAITFMATRTETAPALLFEHPSGASGSAVLTNMLGASAARYALAMGLDEKLSTRAMIAASRQIMQRRIPPTMIDKKHAPVNEIVATGADIDITRFAALKFWPGDGGRYIGTGDITFTRDPVTRRINVGCYRQMVQSADRVSLYCSPGKHGRLDREAWWQRGEPCEVVAAYGVDPVLFMVAAQVFAAGESELDCAGGILGRPVELTHGEFVDLPIPAHCEIAIEGILRPGEFAPEGPLGEFTGYYGGTRGPQPVIEIKAVHRRRHPIVTHALMAPYPSCEIGAYYAIMRSARIWDDLEKIGVPGIAGVYAHPAAASGWGMVVVSLRQLYAGHVAQVLALAAQCPAAAYYTKWVIAVDDDVDPTDFNQVMWALSTRCDPHDDIDLLRKTWSTGLDPSKVVVAERPYGSKALIDACKPHRYLNEFPKRTLLRQSVYETVARRWRELGLEGEPPTFSEFHQD